MDDFPLPVAPSRDRNMLAIELISGSFGGAAQVISGQPLDTLKTVSQESGDEEHEGRGDEHMRAR